MMKYVKNTLFAVFFLVLAPFLSPSPARAQDFGVQDLNGGWAMHALGVYDVRGLYYYGNLTVQEGLITGDPGGAHGSAVADYTGGGFNLGSDGEIQGIIEGRSALGSITISINLGWMGIDKNQITCIGTDQTGMVLMITLVRME